jgi:hypothetical protein
LFGGVFILTTTSTTITQKESLLFTSYFSFKAQPTQKLRRICTIRNTKLSAMTIFSPFIHSVTVYLHFQLKKEGFLYSTTVVVQEIYKKWLMGKGCDAFVLKKTERVSKSSYCVSIVCVLTPYIPYHRFLELSRPAMSAEKKSIENSCVFWNMVRLHYLFNRQRSFVLSTFVALKIKREIRRFERAQ